MGRTGALALVVVVSLTGTALPLVAAQGGPPDHANGDGRGPPDHAGDGDGPPDHASGGGGDGPTVDEDEDEDEADGRPSSDRRSSSGDASPPAPAATPTPGSAPTATRTPTPNAESDGGTDSSGSTSEPGSGSESGSAPTDPGPSVEVTASDGATTATVRGVADGETVSIALRGPALDGEGASVLSIDVGLREGTPFTLSVSRPARDADGVDPAPGIALAYFEVDTDLDPDALANATLTVEPRADLPADGRGRPGDLEVLRYAGGEWRATETTYDEEAGVYAAETSDFSRFAVAVPGTETLEVVDATVPADRVRAGHRITARASIENAGDRTARETLALTLDGETVATREVTLDAGETTTVAFEFAPGAPGQRTVAVGGVEAGRVRVVDGETPTSTDPGDDGSGFGVPAATVVVAAALVTALLAARRDGDGGGGPGGP